MRKRPLKELEHFQSKEESKAKLENSHVLQYAKIKRKFKKEKRW